MWTLNRILYGPILKRQYKRTLRVCFHWVFAIVKAMSETADILFTNLSDVVSKIGFVKVDSHLTSAVAFFFDVCRQILENANVKCEHYHLLP